MDQGVHVLSFCVYSLCRNCNTMQSCCMSIMSVRKAIILKARYKILFDSVRKQVESVTFQLLFVRFINYFFRVKKHFAKEG